MAMTKSSGREGKRYSPFVCERCGKGFSTKGNLTRHIDATHTRNGRTFPCSVCGKIFRRKEDMVTHMRIHTGEKPFQCHKVGCGRKFARISDLRSHERTHMDNKHFHCKVIGCGKRFTRRHDLKKHVNSKHKGCSVPPTSTGMRITSSTPTGGGGATETSERSSASWDVAGVAPTLDEQLFLWPELDNANPNRDSVPCSTSNTCSPEGRVHEGLPPVRAERTSQAVPATEKYPSVGSGHNHAHHTSGVAIGKRPRIGTTARLETEGTAPEAMGVLTDARIQPKPGKQMEMRTGAWARQQGILEDGGRAQPQAVGSLTLHTGMGTGSLAGQEKREWGDKCIEDQEELGDSGRSQPEAVEPLSVAGGKVAARFANLRKCRGCNTQESWSLGETSMPDGPLGNAERMGCPQLHSAPADVSLGEDFHVHSSTCGHKAILHENHVDFLLEGGLLECYDGQRKKNNRGWVSRKREGEGNSDCECTEPAKSGAKGFWVAGHWNGTTGHTEDGSCPGTIDRPERGHHVVHHDGHLDYVINGRLMHPVGGFHGTTSASHGALEDMASIVGNQGLPQGGVSESDGGGRASPTGLVQGDSGGVAGDGGIDALFEDHGSVKLLDNDLLAFLESLEALGDVETSSMASCCDKCRVEDKDGQQEWVTGGDDIAPLLVPGFSPLGHSSVAVAALGTGIEETTLKQEAE